METSQATATSATAQKATAKEWAGLVLLALPMMALSTDLTVLFFALPTISADLEPSATQMLWITHVYGFLIAGFLVTAGRVGDRIGPRRLLMAGAAAFAVLSVVAAYSTSPEMLIAARAALGVAGATLMPSLFSMLRTMFREENQRRMAIAIMFSMFTVGGAVGPLLGGALLEFFWWGSVFLINVPPLVLLLIGAMLLLPGRSDREKTRIDLLSVALSVLGMLAIVYGIQEIAASHENGGDNLWAYALSVIAGAAVMTLFVLRQRRLSEPLFDLGLVKIRAIAVSLVCLLLMGLSITGIFYLFTQYLQWVGGFSPLHAGFWTLPYIAVNILGAVLAPGVAQRVSAPKAVVVGILIAGVGAGAFAVATAMGVPAPLLAIVIAVAGLGHGIAGALVSDLIISGAPEEQAGSAASAQEVGGELGSALGIAMGGTVSVLIYRSVMGGADLSEIPEGQTEAAAESVHHGVTTAEGLEIGGQALLETVHDAVSSGQQVYATAASLVLVAVAVMVLLTLVRKTSKGR
ncbi:MFS transporter [Nesterenkonia ebinurensis]|uniref:MFS transporter n=1 Tax=Nesterenkonia ebinurensis TaxID=2608252 RepID=UPI00123DD2FC|nr:MFS transporter [Nesterenkonia ebinurensis]